MKFISVALLAAHARALELKAGVVWADLAAGHPRMTTAELSRTILAAAGAAALSTRFAEADHGAGMVSHTTFVADERGCPIFTLPPQSQASQNLQDDPAASFFVHSPDGMSQAGSAVTLLGAVEPLEAEAEAETLDALAARSGCSASELATRQLLRLVPQRVHLADAIYGAEAWVPAGEYCEAEPSVLVGDVPHLLSKLNGKHAKDVARFASVVSGVDEGEASTSEVVSLDQLGFDLRVRGAAAEGAGSVVRIGLKVPPQTAEEATSAFTKLFQEAYAKQQGWA